jgi:hypothetical protein
MAFIGDRGSKQSNKRASMIAAKDWLCRRLNPPAKRIRCRYKIRLLCRVRWKKMKYGKLFLLLKTKVG